MLLKVFARRRSGPAVALVVSLVVSGALILVPGGASSGGLTITGSVYKDLNRDRVQQPDEPILAGQQLYLFDGSGAYLGTTLADSSGRYSFDGLAAGDYRVDCEDSALRNDWVPTTTRSFRGSTALTLPGSAVADFGWRPIVRSHDLATPLASYVGPTGLRVETFNDALTPEWIYAELMSGSLIGSEASRVTVRFDYNDTSSTAASVADSNGVYATFQAVSYVGYSPWLVTGENALFHEYGHAWSLYYAFIVQQDQTLAAYLQARGLAGDARVNSSYGWSAREMIAEDYRELFGTPDAQSASQMNRDIPLAKDVPGLRDFLMTIFREPSGPPPPPPPPPPLAVTNLSVNPAPVTTGATVSFELSAPASVTTEIRDKRGKLVRTLLSNTSESAGGVSLNWDRRNTNGRKVASGTYTARVVARDSASASVVQTKSFRVS